jgi:hypothetical protein
MAAVGAASCIVSGTVTRRVALLVVPLAASLVTSLGATAAAQQAEAAAGRSAFVGSYSALVDAWAADVVAHEAAQATMPPPMPPSPPPRRGWQFEAAGFSDEVTLNSVDGYVDDWYSSGGNKVFDWHNVDRTRYGGRFLAGSDQYRFGGEIFTERFDTDDHFSGTGGAFVLLGTPTLARNRDFSWILDSSLRFGWVRDHGDVTFVTPFGNPISDHATLDYEYAQIDLGTGLRFHGVEVAVGMRLDDTLGYLDLDNGSYFYVDSTNLAFYTRVEYQPPGIPLFATATWFVGDVRGLGFVLGVRF